MLHFVLHYTENQQAFWYLCMICNHLWVSLFPVYLAMCPDAGLGTVTCVAETGGLPIFWMIFLRQAALLPYVLTAVTRQSSPGP